MSLKKSQQFQKSADAFHLTGNVCKPNGNHLNHPKDIFKSIIGLATQLESPRQLVWRKNLNWFWPQTGWADQKLILYQKVPQVVY